MILRERLRGPWDGNILELGAVEPTINQPSPLIRKDCGTIYL